MNKSEMNIPVREKIDALFNKLYPLTQVSEAQKLVHVMQFYQENVEENNPKSPDLPSCLSKPFFVQGRRHNEGISFLQ